MVCNIDGAFAGCVLRRKVSTMAKMFAKSEQNKNSKLVALISVLHQANRRISRQLWVTLFLSVLSFFREESRAWFAILMELLRAVYHRTVANCSVAIG